MTKHMFRCYIGKGPMSLTDLETRIDDWKASNTVWTESSGSNTLSETTAGTNDTGTVYHHIDVWFEKTDTKANILQKFLDKLKDKVDWLIAAHHFCPHDEDAMKETVVDEQWTASVGTPVSLINHRLSKTPLIDPSGKEYKEGVDFEVDKKSGDIMALSDGSLVDGQTYNVSYHYYSSGGPCYWAEEAETWTAKDVTIPSDVDIPKPNTL